MPGLFALSQLRDLLPLVDRLLPLVTRAAGKAAHAEAVELTRKLEQLQGESRGLRLQSGDQSAQLTRIEGSLEQVAAGLRAAEERRREEHQALLRAVARQRSATIAGVASVILIGLIVLVLLALLLLHTGHAG